MDVFGQPLFLVIGKRLRRESGGEVVKHIALVIALFRPGIHLDAALQLGPGLNLLSSFPWNIYLYICARQAVRIPLQALRRA